MPSDIPEAPDIPRQVVRVFFDALNAHDLDRAVRQLSPAYRGVDVSRSARSVGAEEARSRLQAGLTAFPDLSLTVHQCVADGVRVSVLWAMTGTHEGAFLRVPPTGQSVSISGVGLFTVREGQITRGVYQWDLAGFLRAVKLLPELPEGTLSSTALADIDQ